MEDDFFIRDIYEIAARSAGYDVTSAVDGEEAISKIKSLSPDLVLLDLMLPKVDGISVIKATRADPKTKDIPIVVITNLEDSTKEQEARNAGANDYLLKIKNTPNQVLEKIKQYI